MRRALVLALAALAVGAAPAAADPGIAFEVDGRAVVVGADALAAAADVGPATYLVDGAPQTLTGTSVRVAVQLAGADPDAVSAVTASADLALLQLTRPELAAASPFPEGPALVWVDAEGRTSLLRPASAGGRPAEVIRSAPGHPLSVAIEGATLVEVAIIASVEQARPGQAVPLLARSGREDATYTWDFGDGTSAVGAEVEHRFRRAGRYRVTVTVSDGAGGGGTSAPVLIEVGAPARPRTANSVPASDAKRDSTGGPPAPAPVADSVPASDVKRDSAVVAEAPAEASAPPRASKPKKAPQRARPRDPGAVSGTLLADVSTPQSLAVRQAAVAAARPADAGARRVPAMVFVVLGALAALGFGAATQIGRR